MQKSLILLKILRNYAVVILVKLLIDTTFSGIQLTLPFLHARSHCYNVFEKWLVIFLLIAMVLVYTRNTAVFEIYVFVFTHNLNLNVIFA